MGTTSKFDETLVLLGDLTGLPLQVYKFNRPNGKGGFRGSSAEVCPDMDYCRRAVQQAAPIDHRMWDKWGAAFDSRIQALGAEFEARVAQFKADVKAAQPAWRAAPRAQTICRCAAISACGGGPRAGAVGGGGGYGRNLVLTCRLKKPITSPLSYSPALAVGSQPAREVIPTPLPQVPSRDES